MVATYTYNEIGRFSLEKSYVKHLILVEPSSTASVLIFCYSRVHKKCNNLRINYRGENDFEATIGLKNNPIYMF